MRGNTVVAVIDLKKVHSNERDGSATYRSNVSTLYELRTSVWQTVTLVGPSLSLSPLICHQYT